MALSNCTDCEAPVSDDAKACRQCGKPTDSHQANLAWLWATLAGVGAVVGFVALLALLPGWLAD